VGTTPTGHSFADTGFDWSIGDRFTDDEKERLLAWYRETHGSDDLKLVGFAPFLIEHLPAAYKLSRRHLLAIPEPRDGVALPGVASVLCYLHSYCAIAYTKGILYEIINARRQGASKQLILDVLNYAYLSAGPRGMNAVAELSDSYLRAWQDDDGSEPLRWPDRWAPDPAVFRSGIDHATLDMTSDEILAVSLWHQKMHGNVPRHVELFARLHPRAYKLQRIRYERAIGTVMPAQLAPLMSLHLATMRLQPLVMRQALHQARVLGVRRHQVVQVLFYGLRQSIDPMVMEAAAEAVGDLLAGWEE
jgi:hypothetical protein